jgi:hypothetical protein
MVRGKPNDLADLVHDRERVGGGGRFLSFGPGAARVALMPGEAATIVEIVRLDSNDPVFGRTRTLAPADGRPGA